MRKMNIVLLANGNGQRFINGGYKTPKPLLPVFGMPMFHAVIKNTVKHLVPQDWDFTIHVVSQEKHELYNEKLIGMEHKINHIVLPTKSEGALTAAIEALPYIDNDDPVMVVNCDQLIKIDKDEWCDKVYREQLDFVASKERAGLLIHFLDTDGTNNFGYSEFNEFGYVSQIEEKNAISWFAHTGHYIYSNKKTFEEAGRKVIDDKIKVNMEYFISPSFSNIPVTVPFVVQDFVCLGDPNYYGYFRNFKEKEWKI